MVTKKKSIQPRPFLQWAMAILGGLLTLGVIITVVWEAMQPGSPPALQARIVRVTPTAAGHVAMVEIVNTGGETASAVNIEGRLGRETATATIDYVPRHGHAQAFLRFDADPRDATVSVLGWSCALTVLADTGPAGRMIAGSGLAARCSIIPSSRPKWRQVNVGLRPPPGCHPVCRSSAGFYPASVRSGRLR